VVLHSGVFAFIGAEPARFHSSPLVTRKFCGACGTPLTYQHSSRPESIDVTTVTLGTPEEFAPTKEIWVEERLTWETLNDAIPRYPGSSVDAPPLPADTTRV
jgi:hypothetical protein